MLLVKEDAKHFARESLNALAFHTAINLDKMTGAIFAKMTPYPPLDTNMDSTEDQVSYEHLYQFIESSLSH